MLVLLYFLISLTSAFLLFMVQPIAAKAVLPILGGAPFVWNGCMLFFQTLLLGGYFYAHTIIQRLSTRQQVIIHLSLLGVALLIFPSSFGNTSVINAANYPLLWLMVTLTLSIGIPFFALSATAPTIQGWFALAGHRRSANPYFLYSASNMGSFSALIGYLVFIEPNLTRSAQLMLLHVLFGVLVALFISAGVKLYRAGPQAQAAINADDGAPLDWPQIRYWLTLSFVPSSLLYGVTLYITTDVASIPLLWVIPLALYLLTFVLVFSDKPVGMRMARYLHIPAATTILMVYLSDLGYDMWLMLVHLAAFFLIVMSCHSSLSQSRPAAAKLTHFYLWISLGGVLGGIFNIFVAPHLFTNITEYPLMIFLSVAVCMPPRLLQSIPWKREVALPAGIILFTSFVFYLILVNSESIAASISRQSDEVHYAVWELVYELVRMVVVVMLCFGAQRYIAFRGSLFLSLLVGFFVMSSVYPDREYMFEKRNIFGVSRVFYVPDINVNLYRHGTTDHGKQSRDPERRLELTSYYGYPLGMVFEALGQDKKLAGKPVAAIGLGVGTVACYGTPGQQFDFFEIDSLVLKIAENENLFTYLRDCPPEINVEIGDGRINLAKKENGRYGIAIIDAFTSDAVPMHLMTLEAVSMYLDKLADGGVLAFNVSNRHLDLMPVLSTIAHQLGIQAYAYRFFQGEDDTLLDSADWVVLTRDENFGERLQKLNGDWVHLEDNNPDELWRDDFSNIFDALKLNNGFWGLFGDNN